VEASDAASRVDPGTWSTRSDFSFELRRIGHTASVVPTRKSVSFVSLLARCEIPMRKGPQRRRCYIGTDW